jgi:hypothetical protein
MPSPAGAFNTTNNTVWDEFSDYWGPATSTPDLSTLEIPVSYKVALESGAPGITQKIEEAQKPGETWADAAIRIATSLAMGVQQFQFMQINVDRARKGQPPIDAAQYSGAYVNVGLNPETQRLVTYAGIGLLALVVLNMVSKKK